MKICNCPVDIEELLCDIPNEWRDPIVQALCFTFDFVGDFTCTDIKKCETVTKFDTFYLEGNTLIFKYKDENGDIKESTLDISYAIDDALDEVDPKCLMSPIDWQNIPHVQKIQALIDAQCGNCCATTTTTTSSTTTTTTQCCTVISSTIVNN